MYGVNGTHSLLPVQDGTGENHTIVKAPLLLPYEWFFHSLRQFSQPGELLLAAPRSSDITG